MSSSTFFLVYVVLLVVVLSPLILMRRRQKKFHSHLLASRQLQLQSQEAFQEGNKATADLLLAAAQEEIDRAKYYR